MTDDVRKALGTADTVCGMSLDTDWDVEVSEALEVLAAELRRLDGQRCDTCKHKQPAEREIDGPWCAYLTDCADGNRVLCCDMGATVTDTDGGCRAHSPKETT